MRQDRIDRQQFLRLMGASLGLMGLTACSAQPAKSIVPYVRQPEEIVPGKPLFYASATTLGGYAFGTLVKTTTGRPIKVEGNVDHPASLGATDVFGQASVLTLYDPDRSQAILKGGQPQSWEDFLRALTSSLDDQRLRGGAGMRVLTETVTSPSLADQLQTLLKQFPGARWHQYDPVNRDNPRAGALQAFGEYVDTQYHFDQAEVILTLDADFLGGTFPGHLRYAHDFAETRRIATGRTNLSRLYAVESSPSITGTAADHRWPVRAGDVVVVATALAARLGLPGLSVPTGTTNTLPSQALTAIVEDLQAHRGTSVIVVGDQQPPAVHVLGHRLNQLLGNVGKTIFYTAPVEANPVDQTVSLRDLVQAMNAGQVDLLLILGSNPVYDAPADLSFGSALARVGTSVHLGLYPDETAALATWHVPQAHELEAWGDARAFDGTVTILQPTIAPLYDGKSILEVLGIAIGAGAPTSLEVVQGYWQRQHAGADFQSFWRTSLNNGTVAGTALPERTVKLTTPSTGTTSAAESSANPTSLEIIFRPDPTIYDGRFANNGWLQELPKPLTTLTWDNVVELSAATAGLLGLKNEDLVELTYRGRTVRAPVWVSPGHPDDAATIHLGFGRTRAGRVGNGVGFNAYLLRTSDRPWFDTGLTLRPTGQQHPLAATQGQQSMAGRPVLLNGTVAQYRANPLFAKEAAGAPDGSLYPPVAYPGYAWGMAIDLSTCIGCKACEIACQAENNIPIVGKDQVRRERIMHWIRIDRYYQGNSANPVSFAQPVPCMQCENAPCELVCPVGATVHSDEGLNDMVYNRCVGTRYCSNNCPYKVRRFNFYQYADWTTPSLKLLHNPDVTVRERGVMEKCTYCVQRINAARVQAQEAGRPIRDGDVLTACQAVCPTQAIVFGNINDPNSKVAQLKRTPLNYTLLGDLNTRPRTTYLAAIRNPNPAVAE